MLFVLGTTSAWSEEAPKASIWGSDLEAALTTAQAKKQHVLVYVFDGY